MIYPVESLYTDEANHEVSIRCGGVSFLITLPDYTEAKHRFSLEEGSSMDEEGFDFLTICDTKLACIKQAFRHLSYGDISSRSLSIKLRKKFDASTTETVIDMLRDHGYLRDTALANAYAFDWYTIKLWGPRRIRGELRGKGFSPEDALHALEQLEDFDHCENIRKYIEKKYKVIPDDPRERQKVISALSRAGYDYDDIKNVMNEFSD